MTRLLLSLFFIAAVALTPVYAQQGITPCASATLSVSGTSSNVQLSACGETALLWNVGTQELFYTIGAASNTAATTSSNSLPGNSFVVLNVSNAKLYLAAITATSTTNLRITQGLTR
jgi:hypothetical protein